MGRTFVADEFLRERNRVIVISHGMWQLKLGRDPSVIGRTVILDGDAYVVVGVLPPTFRPRILQGAGERVIYFPHVMQDIERRIRGVQLLERRRPAAAWREPRAGTGGARRRIEASRGAIPANECERPRPRAAAARPPRGQHAAGAEAAVRGRGAAPAHRRRERRQSSPGARRRADARARGAVRGRRRTRPAGAAAARREPSARDVREPGRIARRVVDRSRHRGAESGHSQHVERHDRRRV